MTSERPCLNGHDDYRCTLDRGHVGEHVADDGQRVVARWIAAGSVGAGEDGTVTP